jgi:hypothetical protein
VGPYARWELGDGLSRLSTRRRPGHSTDIKWGGRPGWACLRPNTKGL